jgi:hypothetical protein
MKTWYKAVCDEHKIMCNIFVDHPTNTSLYLSDKDREIYTWLMSHIGCNLRLIHRDEDLDVCFKSGYVDVSWTK